MIIIARIDYCCSEASSAVGRAVKQSKEDVIAEMNEEVRVALISLDSNDPITVQAKANIMAYKQAVEDMLYTHVIV